MCQFLSLHPLFIVRIRHAGEWYAVRSAGGLLYMSRTKIFPPGQEDLTRRIWRQMRLPVAVWNDWHGQFYSAVGGFVNRTTSQYLFIGGGKFVSEIPRIL